jgi:hypothetical protein
MRRLGIVRKRHHLLWGVKHGFGYRWLPYPIKRVIVKIWNRFSCRIWGHEDYGVGVCGSCSKVTDWKRRVDFEIKVRTIHMEDDYEDQTRSDPQTSDPG